MNLDSEVMISRNQKSLKQANEAKSRELEASRKFEKIEKDMLEQIEELLKKELNVKRNFNIDKQDMLEQIEGLKKELLRVLTLEAKSAHPTTVCMLNPGQSQQPIAEFQVKTFL